MEEIKIRNQRSTVNLAFVLFTSTMVIYLMTTAILKWQFILNPSIIYLYWFLIAVTGVFSIRSLIKKDEILITLSKDGMKIGGNKNSKLYNWKELSKTEFLNGKLLIYLNGKKSKKGIPMLAMGLGVVFDKNKLISAIKEMKPQELEFKYSNEIYISYNSKHMNMSYRIQFGILIIIQAIILYTIHYIFFAGVLLVYLYSHIYNKYYSICIDEKNIYYKLKKYARKEIEKIYINNNSLCMNYKGKERIIVKKIKNLISGADELQEILKEAN